LTEKFLLLYGKATKSAYIPKKLIIIILFNSCAKLTGNFALELTQSNETLPNLRTFHLENMSVIPKTKKFLNGLTTVFPNLQFLNLNYEWNHISDSRFIKAIQKSSGKTLMIVTLQLVEDLRQRRNDEDRKAENTSWDDQEIVHC
jgi:hypothetical protein